LRFIFPFIHSYPLRKTCDFFLLMLSFMTFVFLFSGENIFRLNQHLRASNIVNDTVQYQYKRSSAILESLSHRDKHSLTKTEKKVLVKEFRFQSKKYAQSKFKPDNGNDDAAMKIILIILLALGLAFLLSLLACSIACAGLEVIAVLVAIVGLAAIFWLAAVLIRDVNKKKSAKSFSNPVSS
jgi:Flp pilus assembly protein TadB